MLVYVRDAQLLADLAKRFNAIQKESGDLREVSVREHHGVKYERRLERHGENYAYIHDHLLAFSTREAMLQQVIDLEKKPIPEEPALVRQLRRQPISPQQRMRQPPNPARDLPQSLGQPPRQR